MQFGTISVSDGISMGHEGMHFSLVSREIIADSVEAVMQAERLDGMVNFAGCDKSLPGMLMAAARLDVASVFVYAGSILPGNVTLSDGSNRDVTIIDAFEAVGACARGLMSEEDVDRIERAICQVKVHVAVCTPQTPWHLRLRQWECRCQDQLHLQPLTAAVMVLRSHPVKQWSI